MKTTLLSLLLLLSGTVLLAQQPEAVDVDEEQVADATSEATEDPADSNNEQADTELPDSDPVPDIDSQPIDSSQSQGPGRFIPSEQISQDFGVSFPVDI
ncbi:MAG: hypothetical protein WD071_03090 [Pseudohongiella sp.]|uniref:hypothetical protein n=1 Tax=Pseudohongiella sp. TaxID=1979412 RepID=UPI0034A00C91